MQFVYWCLTFYWCLIFKLKFEEMALTLNFISSKQLDLELGCLQVFCLLVPTHCSWRASTEIADITFVCQTVVHCLHMDFEIPLSGSSVIAQMALILHPLVFLLILMPFQFLQNFTFVVTFVSTARCSLQPSSLR